MSGLLARLRARIPLEEGSLVLITMIWGATFIIIRSALEATGPFFFVGVRFAFAALALILFSSRNLAVLISFLIVLPVLYTNLLSGIRAADPQLLEMARVFRVPALRGIRYVYLPQVLPYFRSACGSALGLCWKSGIAAEVIGMPDGSIGEQLQQAKIYLNTPDLFAWTLVIVLVSLIFEKVFLALLKRGERALERM